MRTHRITIDGGDWIDYDELEHPSDLRVTLTINEAQLADAVAAALNRHDKTKTYAGGAFAVKVEKR